MENGTLAWNRRELLLRGLSWSGLAIWGAAGRARWGDAEGSVLAAARALADGRQVRVRLLLPEGSGANVTPVTRSFEAATGVRIEMREVPVDEVASTAMLESVSGSVSFDIALPPTFGVPDLAEGDVVRPLDELVERHEPADLSPGRLYPLGSRYKGRFYGYQADGDVYVMFYNGGLLRDGDLGARYADLHGEELGVPRTWEALDRQMAFFHDPDAGRFGGTLFRVPGYLEWEWWIRLHAKGVLPVDDEMVPAFDGPEGLAALEELVAASAWQTPGAATQGLFGNWADFAEGHAYCNIGWGGTQKFLNGPESSVRERLVFGPTPGGEVGGELVPISYFNWGWNYVISRASSEPELAYLFTLYASLPGPSTESVRARAGFFDPHRVEHYGDPQVVGAYTEPFLRQHRASLKGCLPDFYLQGRGEYFALLGRYLDRANRGELSPERALLLAARGWELVTDRLGREGQIEQWRRLKASYPAHVLAAAAR
ncbi:MAG: extracellular solute-binding protein [Planctomycetota bacterium]